MLFLGPMPFLGPMSFLVAHVIPDTHILFLDPHVIIPETHAILGIPCYSWDPLLFLGHPCHSWTTMLFLGPHAIAGPPCILIASWRWGCGGWYLLQCINCFPLLRPSGQRSRAGAVNPPKRVNCIIVLDCLDCFGHMDAYGFGPSSSPVQLLLHYSRERKAHNDWRGSHRELKHPCAPKHATYTAHKQNVLLGGGVCELTPSVPGLNNGARYHQRTHQSPEVKLTEQAWKQKENCSLITPPPFTICHTRGRKANRKSCRRAPIHKCVAKKQFYRKRQRKLTDKKLEENFKRNIA